MKGARRQKRGKGRGGARPGSGRPPGPRAWVQHRARGAIPGRFPVLVTLRARLDLPSLRGPAIVRELRRSLAVASERGDFRVVRFALETDRVHFLVEAKGKDALSRGMKSIAARVGRAVNRACRRNGPVLDGRYRHRLLATPLEVERAIAELSRLGHSSDAGSRELSAPHTRLLRAHARPRQGSMRRKP